MNNDEINKKIDDYRKAIEKTKSKYLKKDYTKAIKKLERKKNNAR